MTFKRRRRTSSLATTAAAAVATLMGVAQGGEPKLIAEPQHQDHRDGDHATVDEGHPSAASHHPDHPEFRRRLARSAAAAFASWTPEKASRAVPLDLKIDASTGDAYVQGLNGYLEPYADAFRHNSSQYWDSIVSVEKIVEGEDAHVQSAREGPTTSRLYYKILEEDGIEPRTTRRQKGLRGRRGDKGRALEEETAADVVQLNSVGFRIRAASESDDAHDDLSEVEEFHVFQGDRLEEEEGEGREEELISNPGRSLQGYLPQDIPKDLTALGNKKNKNKNKNNKNVKKKKLPQIDRLSPAKGSSVQGKQTFSARVQPSDVTKVDIDSVSFQLEDHNGASSGWLTVPRVSPSLYEITVDGFDRYPGTRWKYTMEAKDVRGKKQSAGDIAFVVDGVGGSGCSFAGCKTGGPDGGSPGGSKSPSNPAPSPPLPKTKVGDANWPHGGAIQAATGRIMFEFDDGTDQSFVCSGTVVMDGRRGQSPDDDNGRAVIQTAAHCAYNDVLKKFANKAVFIPDQTSTRGDKSNFLAGDDPYGMWYLSFATIARGWADGSFPENVPYDYAYYTVFDDPHTHEGGYLGGITGVLDHDVAPMAIDFDVDPFDEFIFSIGYSADKDPKLRHCSMENTAINGVPWYTNLWLKDCAMTGGASGGPWMSDMDKAGVGTLISVNSWGFTHKAGMAGPVLRTSEGSWAECLFEKAKSANDPGREGGIIVKNC